MLRAVQSQWRFKTVVAAAAGGAASWWWLRPSDLPSDSPDATATDPFDLRRRFVTTQRTVFPRALAEIEAGAKESHWSWCVPACERAYLRASRAPPLCRTTSPP